MAAPDLSDAIQQNATSPNSATADGVTVTQNPPSEQIEADKYLAAKSAGSGPPFGIVVAALKFPGAQ